MGYVARIDDGQADTDGFLLAATMLWGGVEVAAFRFEASLTGPIEAGAFQWRPTLESADETSFSEQGELLYGDLVVAQATVELRYDAENDIHEVTVHGNLVGAPPIDWSAERTA